MEREQAPASRPEKEIVLALKFKNVSEETRYQRGGRQQRQCNETLMSQSRVRFSVYFADGSTTSHRAAKATLFRAALFPALVSGPCFENDQSPRLAHTNTPVRPGGVSRHYTKQSLTNYGVPFFLYASVPAYWWRKRQHTGGNA